MFPLKNSLCCFATYRKCIHFDVNVIEYIKQLGAQFEHVVVMTNDDFAVPYPKSIGNVTILLAPNYAYDFGHYWTFLEYIMSQNFIPNIIGLVNDSCYVIKPFEFDVQKVDHHVWGICMSYETTPHLQSFFLVFNGNKAIRSLFEFVKKNSLRNFKLRNKMDLIQKYEIGLSRFLIEQGFKLHPLYTISRPDDKDTLGKAPLNPSYISWDRLIENGCPLLKKKRRSKRTHLIPVNQFPIKKL